jgi:hypothetical protein
MPSWRMMSPTTRRVAVAVSARIGTPPSGPEVVPPLRDAVRLVDRDQRHPHVAEEVPEPALEPLGRDVDELVLAGAQASQALAPRVPVEARVEHRRAEAGALERVDLILHERDERAHDERRAVEDARGDLIGERLPRARRHDADAVAAAEDRVDDLLLPGTELGEAEDVGQDVAGSEAARERELVDRRFLADGGSEYSDFPGSSPFRRTLRRTRDLRQSRRP